MKQHVQDAFVYGSHNSLCLAHGRKPIQEVRKKFTTFKFKTLFHSQNFLLQYVSYEFPQFTSLVPNPDIQCAINATSATKNFSSFILLVTIFQLLLLK